jgi:import inner membrane translocase subunit TIM44
LYRYTLEDMRERWETSDNPMVHRIQDMQEGMFTETEQAEAYRVIRNRQPAFNINDFLAEVRRDVPKVLGAYLKGDEELLKATNISKEMLERMGGQMKLWQHEGRAVASLPGRGGSDLFTRGPYWLSSIECVLLGLSLPGV